MRVDLEAHVGGRLPSDVETALYRIVQEALTNIVKHAQARTVSIVLARSAARDHGGDRGRRTRLHAGRRR